MSNRKLVAFDFDDTIAEGKNSLHNAAVIAMCAKIPGTREKVLNRQPLGRVVNDLKDKDFKLIWAHIKNQFKPIDANALSLRNLILQLYLFNHSICIVTFNEFPPLIKLFLIEKVGLPQALVESIHIYSRPHQVNSNKNAMLREIAAAAQDTFTELCFVDDSHENVQRAKELIGLDNWFIGEHRVLPLKFEVMIAQNNGSHLNTIFSSLVAQHPRLNEKSWEYNNSNFIINIEALKQGWTCTIPMQIKRADCEFNIESYLPIYFLAKHQINLETLIDLILRDLHYFPMLKKPSDSDLKKHFSDTELLVLRDLYSLDYKTSLYTPLDTLRDTPIEFTAKEHSILQSLMAPELVVDNKYIVIASEEDRVNGEIRVLMKRVGDSDYEEWFLPISLLIKHDISLENLINLIRKELNLFASVAQIPIINLQKYFSDKDVVILLDLYQLNYKTLLNPECSTRAGDSAVVSTTFTKKEAYNPSFLRPAKILRKDNLSSFQEPEGEERGKSILMN